MADLGHPGKFLSRLKTGARVDNLEYDPARHRLFIAAAKDGTLTIARVSNAGALVPEATIPTAQGARNPWWTTAAASTWRMHNTDSFS